MPGTSIRNIKILGAAWLGMGGLTFAIVFMALFQIFVTSEEVEGGSLGGLIFVLVLLVLGSIQVVNGLALLRRNPVARPLIAISSILLLPPSVLAVFPLLFVAPSLWLTLSSGGKRALASYMARESG